MKKVFKNSIVYILLFSMLAVFIPGCDPGPVGKSDAGYLKPGDYLEFGRYLGNDILWRIIEKNDGGILLISQYILCYKPFDAKGDLTESRGTKDRMDYGSNYWAKSNLHDWLNSDGKKVAYTQQAPDKEHVEQGYNNYENEPGFLYEFTNREKNSILTYSSKTALADADKELKSSGTAILNTTDSNIDSYISGDSYNRMSNDKVTILSAEEIKALLKDKGAALDTTPTSFVPANNYNRIPDSEKCSYWVRTPDTLTSDGVCRIDHGMVLNAKAYSNSIGVRPVVYIDTGILKSGIVIHNGTMANPYKLINTYTPSNPDSAFKLHKDEYCFANSDVSFGYGKDYKIPVQRYNQVFGDPQNEIPGEIINELQEMSPWVGSCLGMSVTAKLFNTGFFKYSDFIKGAACTHDFKAPETPGSSVTELIEQYQIYQEFGREVIDEYMNSPKDVAGVLNRAMNGGPAVIEVRGDMGGECGHALLPYKFEKQQGSIYKVYVYDCNEPESEDRVLTMNTADNTWEYKLFSDGNILWGSGKKYSKIYCRRISAFLNKPTPSWRSNATSLYVSNASSVVIKSSRGTARYMDGELTTDIEGACLIPISAVSKEKRVGRSTSRFLLPSDEYVVTVDDNSKALKTNDIMFMGNDKILLMKGINNMTPVSINPLKGSINIKPDSMQKVNITIFSKRNNSKGIGYTLEGQINKNSDINISLDDDDSIKVKSDKSTRLKVRVSQPQKRIIKDYDLKVQPNLPKKLDISNIRRIN